MSRIRRSPLRTVVVVAAALVAVASLPAERVAAARNAERRCWRAADDVGVGRWSSLRLPPVESPPHRTHKVEYEADLPWRFSVSESDPRVIYIWNLWRAFKSTDGGCTWEESFNTLTTSSSPIADLTDEIVAVQAPRLDRAGMPTYMVVQRGATPFLGVQDDASDEWRMTALTDAAGVPVTGRAIQLWVAPSDPDTLYLEMGTDTVLRADNEDRSRLYGSTDGGRTWDLRTVFAPDSEGFTQPYGDFSCPAGPSPCPRVHVTAMEVHPERPNVLWTGTYDGIFRSEDGGRSWHNVYRATWETFGRVDAIELVADPSAPLRIGVFGVLATGWSEDGGRSWELRDVPMGVGAKSGRRFLSPIDSAASSDRAHSLVLLGTSWGERQAQIVGPHGWTYVAPAGRECVEGSWASGPECLRHAAYVGGARSYLAVDRDGQHLWKLELRR